MLVVFTTERSRNILHEFVLDEIARRSYEVSHRIDPNEVSLRHAQLRLTQDRWNGLYCSGIILLRMYLELTSIEPKDFFQISLDFDGLPYIFLDFLISANRLIFMNWSQAALRFTDIFDDLLQIAFGSESRRTYSLCLTSSQPIFIDSQWSLPFIFGQYI